MRKAGRLRIIGALGSVVALAALAQGGAFAGAADKNDDVAVIKAKANLEEKRLFFKAPATVEDGQKLKIVNRTDAKEVGPHTFSLVKSGFLPETKGDMKACFKSGICGQIAKWHEIEFSKDSEDFTVNRPKVRVGKKGWNKLGDDDTKGDSVFLEDKGDSFAQKVNANVGKDLYFICAIHPDMQGKVTVTG